MLISFFELFLMNLKLLYRNPSGLFFTIVMPSVIYIALSILPINRVLGSQINYSNYVLPGIIAMTIMQGGIYGLAYYMVDLKARGVIKRFLVAPISQTEWVLSLLFSRTLILLIQACILTLIGVIFFNAEFAFNIISSLLFILFGGFIFLLTGLLIASVADSYEAAAPITAAIGLPLTFLSNIFYPLEVLPSILEKIAHVLPITYLATGLRESYLMAFDMTRFIDNITPLFIWFIVMLALVLWRFRLTEE